MKNFNRFGLPSKTTEKETSMVAMKSREAKFSLGNVVATPGALDALAESKQSATTFLERHVVGDWGDVDHDDWQFNEESLVEGERVLSSYMTLKGTKIWVITEADRSTTTLLLPEEY